jgi:hypothetical protein
MPPGEPNGLAGGACGVPENTAAVPKTPLHLPFLTFPAPFVHIPPAAQRAHRVLKLPFPPDIRVSYTVEKPGTIWSKAPEPHPG